MLKWQNCLLLYLYCGHVERVCHWFYFLKLLVEVLFRIFCFIFVVDFSQYLRCKPICPCRVYKPHLVRIQWSLQQRGKTDNCTRACIEGSTGILFISWISRASLVNIFYFIFECLCHFTPCLILGCIFFGCEDFIQQRFVNNTVWEAELKGFKISDLKLTIFSFLFPKICIQTMIYVFMVKIALIIK